MNDLNERLRGIDRLSPPDLWASAQVRATAGPTGPIRPSTTRRFAVVVGALTIGLAAVAFAVAAFTSSPDAEGPISAVAVQNGDLWVQVGGGELGTAIYRVGLDGDAGTRTTEAIWTDSGDVFSGTPVAPDLIATDYAFSPDGNQVAFSAQVQQGGSEVPRELFVMDADGTDRRQLTHDGGFAGFPAWSPDGSTIAYASYRGTDYIPGCLGFSICSTDLYVTDLTGGAPTLLAGGEASETTPTWSPDASRIAFAEIAADGLGTIVTMEADGAARVTLTPTGDVSFPAWSPDGRSIVYLSGQDGTNHLWTVAPDGSASQDIVDTGTDTNVGRPVWSPEGDLIAFARPYAGADTSVWLVDPAGSETPERIAGWPGFNGAPIAWRPVPGEPAPTTATSVSIPDVVGMTLEEASATITGSGLSVGTVEQIPSSTVPQGSVVSTTPWAGTEAEWPPHFEVAIIVSSGPDDEGPIALPGIDSYLVCRVVRISGDFGSAGDGSVVFEEERVPGAGCVTSEGFQHVAVIRDGAVTALSRRITDILSDDAWKVWPYATPDLDGDGVDEIALATVRPGGGRHVWFFKVQNGGIDPVVEGGVGFSTDIGTVAQENRAQTVRGMYCEGGGSSRTVVTWQADADDALHVYESVWRLDGLTMRSVSERETRVSDTEAYPPMGDDELC